MDGKIMKNFDIILRNASKKTNQRVNNMLCAMKTFNRFTTDSNQKFLLGIHRKRVFTKEKTFRHTTGGSSQRYLITSVLLCHPLTWYNSWGQFLWIVQNA